MSEGIKRDLSKFGLPTEIGSLKPGEVRYYYFPASSVIMSRRICWVVGYAASVDIKGMRSTENILEDIFKEIKKRCTGHMRTVNIPLLGSGAGKMDSYSSYRAIKDSFENSDLLVKVYVNENIYNKLKGISSTHSIVGKRTNESRYADTQKEKTKIFISHSNEDKEYVKAFVDMLVKLGLRGGKEGNLVCTSVSGYGVPLGESVYEWLLKQFKSYRLHVISFLSDNYYKSPACLNEMGAAWALKSKYQGILLPGFKIENMKGCVEGNKDKVVIILDDDADKGRELKHRLNELKDSIVKECSLKEPGQTDWESWRDDFIDRVNELKDKKSVKEIRREGKPVTLLVSYADCLEQLIEKINLSNIDECSPSELSDLLVWMKEPFEYLHAKKRVDIPKKCRENLQHYKDKVDAFEKELECECDLFYEQYVSYIEDTLIDFPDHPGLLEEVKLDDSAVSKIRKTILTRKYSSFVKNISKVSYLGDPDTGTYGTAITMTEATWNFCHNEVIKEASYPDEKLSYMLCQYLDMHTSDEYEHQQYMLSEMHSDQLFIELGTVLQEMYAEAIREIDG